MSADASLSGDTSGALDDEEFLTAGAGGEMSALVEIDRDEDGHPVAMRLVSAVGGHAEFDTADDNDDLESTASTITSRTMQIPLGSDADREIAGRFLQTMGVPYVPRVTDPSDITGAAITPERFRRLAADLGDLAQERGFIYEQEYTSDSSTDYAAQVDLKMGAGIGGANVSNRRETTSCRYGNGQVMVERSGCAA